MSLPAAFPSKMPVFNSHIMQDSLSVVSSKPRLHTKKKQKQNSFNKNPESLCYEQKHISALI